MKIMAIFDGFGTKARRGLNPRGRAGGECAPVRGGGHAAHQDGIALIIVMISITVLAILAGGFAYSMKVETKLARNANNLLETKELTPDVAPMFWRILWIWEAGAMMCLATLWRVSLGWRRNWHCACSDALP